ncbi:MAG TPA: hypothetical protein VFN74_13250, partial [Chloroflexota bacterium]|nr:hypothetical protein [Chloroflexota bacterium]
MTGQPDMPSEPGGPPAAAAAPDRAADPVAPTPTAGPSEATASSERPLDPVEAQRRLIDSLTARQGLARTVFRRFGWQPDRVAGASDGLFGPGEPPIVNTPRIPARSPFMSVVGAAELRQRAQHSQPLGAAHERVEQASGSWAPEELFWWHRLSPAARMLGRRHEAPPPVRTHV